MRTDTEILDWIIVHSPQWDSDYKSGKHWIKWFRESYWYVAYGKSFRECVSNVIDGKFEKVLY